MYSCSVSPYGDGNCEGEEVSPKFSLNKDTQMENDRNKIFTIRIGRKLVFLSAEYGHRGLYLLRCLTSIYGSSINDIMIGVGLCNLCVS